MAGDWIKLECTTPDKPEIVQMATLLRIDQDAVVGKLLRVWVWADQNSVAGEGVKITAAFIDRLTNHCGFADAMGKVGWLAGEDGAMSFPNFGRHNGSTGKMRAASNRRMTKSRDLRRNGCANVAEKAQQKAQPEKRREEVQKRTDPLPEIPPVPAGSASPPDAPARESASLTEVAAAAPRVTVILPTLNEAKAFAFTAGVAPDAAECWWHDCEARPLASDGHYTGRDGNMIKNWRPHLIAFGRRWQSHEARHRPRGSPPRSSAGFIAPAHSNPDEPL